MAATPPPTAADSITSFHQLQHPHLDDPLNDLDSILDLDLDSIFNPTPVTMVTNDDEEPITTNLHPISEFFNKSNSIATTSYTNIDVIRHSQQQPHFEMQNHQLFMPQFDSVTSYQAPEITYVTPPVTPDDEFIINNPFLQQQQQQFYQHQQQQQQVQLILPPSYNQFMAAHQTYDVTQQQQQQHQQYRE